MLDLLNKHQSVQGLHKTTHFLFIFSCFIYCLLNSLLVVADNAKPRILEYQQASAYTHLAWHGNLSEKINVMLLPIKNFSGIPIENREESAEYFYHGKLPQIMNDIYADAFYASHYFLPTTENHDYQIELILEGYQLPFSYAADDSWWQKLHDQTDRWLQSPANAGIRLTIKLSSGLRKIKPWMDSVEIVLSECDLNAVPQPQTWFTNKNPIIQQYLSTSPGQSFLAATNYLILKTLDRISQQPVLAKVTDKLGDEIYLTSNSTEFVQGEQLNLFYNDQNKGKSDFPMGQIKIIKAQQNHATAYPITLKSSHIKVGDWVEMTQTMPIEKPISIFESAKQCAKVINSEAISMQ